MATSSRIQLSPSEKPEFSIPGISTTQAEKVSGLLQENHDQHHIFFNKSGFHNHIVHHLLTTYALSATPDTLQHHYDSNKSYQRPYQQSDAQAVSDMKDPAIFAKHLGNEKFYPDYLAFFKDEMSKTSWQAVLNKYLFAGDEAADDMLVRLYGGFLHPIIHLGFGVEFQQPAIIAEALAQAAVHSNNMGPLLLPADRAARKNADKPSKSIVELLDEIRNDEQLRDAPRWSDDNKVRDGVIGRAGERMVELASQFHVKPSELQEKTAEMTNAVAYYTAGAQRKDKAVKYDFYYMHCLNCAIFFPTFMKQEWLSEANKARLLEWKVWLDLAMYASRKSPPVLLDDIQNYKSREPLDWDGIFERSREADDDGHFPKLVRALANGQKLCEPYEDKETFRVKKDDWLRMAQMAVDSMEDGESKWIRSAGFDQAWESVPMRSQL